jgi:hypothetical protein
MRPIVLCLVLSGCFLGGRSPSPTACDPNDPQGADPARFVRCGASQTCVLANKDQSTCVDLAEDRREGDGCAYANECAPGLVCTSLGFCARSCTVGGSSCAGACVAFADHISLDGATFGMCVGPPCDPRDASSCAGTCRFLEDTTACLPLAAGPGADGATCATDVDCASAFVCAGDPGVCRAICADDTTCASGTRCTRAPDVTATVNGVAYGYCG